MEEFFRENRDEVAKNMVLDYTWERREELTSDYTRKIREYVEKV